MRTSRVIFAPVALGAIALVSGCERTAAPSKPAPPAHLERPSKETELATVVLTPEAEKRLAIPQHLGTVEKRRVRTTRTLPADLAPSPQGSSFVLAPFTGIVGAPAGSRLLLPGAAVQRGSTLLLLTPIFLPADQVTLTASLADAEGQLARARVQLEAATVSHRRTEQLVAEKALAVRALEDSRAALDTARATLDAAVARRDVIAATARTLGPGDDRRAATALASPLDGVVKDIRVSPGETVSAGATVAEVVSLAPLLVRVAVPSHELEGIDRTASARIEALLGGWSGSGRSTRTREAKPIANTPPVPSLSAGCVDIFYELANEGLVFVPGERVAAVLTRRSDDESFVVPWGAVLQDALGGTWVYECTAPQTFVRRRIQVQRVEGDVAILATASSLVVGARVVTEGAAELFGTEFGVGK